MNLMLLTKLVRQTANLAIFLNLRSHPAEAGRSTSQPGENLAQTLSEINVNISTMASLLKTIVERQNTEPQKNRRHSQHESLSADSESEDIEYETASKRRREDDELSLSPSDGDIADLLEGSNSKEVEAPSKTTEPEEELELLKSLEADFTYDENVGAKINQSLANIASKRWGITLPNDNRLFLWTESSAFLVFELVEGEK